MFSKAIDGDVTALLDLLFMQSQLRLFPEIVHLSDRYKEKARAW